LREAVLVQATTCNVAHLMEATATEPPCPLGPLHNLPLPHPNETTVILGIEGSANKVCVCVCVCVCEHPYYTTLSLRLNIDAFLKGRGGYITLLSHVTNLPCIIQST
jgi:hypothetical protein